MARSLTRADGDRGWGIDPNGALQYAVVHNLNVGRNVDETLRVLEAIQSGGLCAANWRPGQKHLG